MFISKIPSKASNELLERLLKLCGTLLNWKRSSDPAKPSSFGLAEFEDLESVYVCHRIIHNLTLFGNNILVRVNDKTLQYLQEWAQQKEEEWVAQKGKDYDSAEIAVLKARGEILPYERLLIPQYDMIMKEIREALLDEGSILNKELTFIGAAESTRQVDETKQAEV